MLPKLFPLNNSLGFYSIKINSYILGRHLTSRPLVYEDIFILPQVRCLLPESLIQLTLEEKSECSSIF